MPEQNPVWAATKPFFTGALSGSIATICIQPIDMIKVRIQVNAMEGGTTSPFAIGSQMIRSDGVGSLYKGLSAGLTRQWVYTGARLGLYDKFTELAKDPNEKKMPVVKTAGCALAAGGLAALVGNPADLALIRMQTDSMLPAAERKGYSHVGSALGDILKNEGAGGLFAGAGPTAVRAMALNLGMLAGNSVSKDLICSTFNLKGSDAAAVFGASAVAGFLASFMSLPFDYIKTLLQKQKPDANGVLPFNGALDCARKTVQKGGVTALWTGFPTFYVRIAPHAMITLIAQDQVKKLWASAGL